ncbi:FAS1-like dehydratase domain-containing protein [Agrococcus baldri]|uniref:FAS1-like dehydratase domain-containing protein n=1 Tax=Agrococcus baldri TaxID=153730 RepID=A0AA87RJN9_9MICO|nr:MaoC family dehydratase N-terminal domain-containing protein [Agrococcus baldri]GEK81669.1 hypothetical protein ABA31_30200 [Agrococcus baldri]
MSTAPVEGANDIGNSVEFPIERGAIQRFAAAAQSESADHQGERAIAPATFLMSLAQWMQPSDRVDVGFERARLLHGSQEFHYLGTPPRAGDRLIAQERIADRFEKTGRKGGTMRFAVVETEFRHADTDEIVARMRSTLIERAAR